MPRESLKSFCNSNMFNQFILFLILINTFIISLMTYDFPTSTLNQFDFVDRFILSIFLVELLVKIYAFRSEFFNDNWNNFDFCVILISSIPALTSISAFRTLRVFKILRIISVFPELRKMVEATIRSVRGILAISTLLCVVVYLYAITFHMLFGQSDGVGSDYFGNLGKSIFSLFQVMTLDAWADGMVRELMMEHGSWVAFLFAFFILSTTFTFLNMFIAVFTNTMASIDIEDGDDVGFSRIINEIKSEISELKEAYLRSMNLQYSGMEEE